MWKVYVGNLRSRIREIELADEFRAYGVVRSVWVARNPPGYAFVEFEKRWEADDAISALDGKHGWRVEMSRKSAGSRTHGYSSETRCSDCGSSGHWTRDCRSKGSKDSYRRSSSPHSRTLSQRHSPSRKRSRRRSPLCQNKYRDSSPRKIHEQSGSEKSDQSKSPLAEQKSPHAYHSPRKIHERSGSEKSDQAKSPLVEQSSPHGDECKPTSEEHEHIGSP